MPQTLMLNGFKWIENTSQFHKDFIKIIIEESHDEYFFEVDVQILKSYMIVTMIYPFCLKKRKLTKLKNL